MIQLANHFRRDESRRHSEWLRQQKWFIKAKQDQTRRDKAEERLDDDFAALATDLVIATETQIYEFEQKLDSYDEAIVVALMENQAALDAINARLQPYLDRAYVMEDGRRVFKTEDGSQVFDEFGVEVSPEELDFGDIGPEHPAWESVGTDILDRAGLTQERQQIFEFQAEVDGVRGKIEPGKTTAEELEDEDARLEAIMPPAVRAHVPRLADTEPAPALRSDFADQSRPLPDSLPTVTRDPGIHFQ